MADESHQLDYVVDKEELLRGFPHLSLDSIELGALKAPFIARKLGLRLPQKLLSGFPCIAESGKELGRCVAEDVVAKARPQACKLSMMELIEVDEENPGKGVMDPRLESIEVSAEPASLGTQLGLPLPPALKQGKAVKDVAAAAKDLFWNELTCDELQTVQRALISHFKQPNVQLMLAQKRQACSQDRFKYLYCIDAIVDDAYGQVFRKMGLLEEPESVKEVQEKFQRAVMQFWRAGEVRTLLQELRAATGAAPPRRADVPELQQQQSLVPARRGWTAFMAAKARKRSMTELIVATIRELGYQVDEENLGQGFVDLGLDSFEAATLRVSLGTKLGLHLAAKLMPDFPSVQELSKELLKLIDNESSAEEGTFKPMSQDGLRAGISENLDCDGAFDTPELEGLRKVKQGRTAKKGSAVAKDLFWNELTCGKLENVLRSLIDHFSQHKVQLMLAQKRQACNQDRLKYLFCIDTIVDDGYTQVFRKMGLMEEAERLKEVQEKFQQVVMQCWCAGEVEFQHCHCCECTPGLGGDQCTRRCR